MKEEIKYIIKRLEYVDTYQNCSTSLNGLEIKTLLDYITNLQNENRFLRSHQKLKETFFRFELEDLQKENERFRTALNGSDEKRKRTIEYENNNV